MKKSVLIVAMVALLGACNSSTKTPVTDSTKDSIQQPHQHQASYACPMDCEKGKTYDKPGKCPVCEMDLEKK